MLTLATLSVLTFFTPNSESFRETRTFRIDVDGKVAGKLILRVEKKQDRESFSIHCNATVKQFLFKYQYDLSLTEVWQQGQLVSLHSNCNDDGSKVSLQVDANGQLTINGIKKTISPIALTLTGCRLPNYETNPRKYQALDVDTGRVTVVEVKATHRVTVPVAERTINGLSYLFSADNQHADVWFDDSGMLIGAIRKDDGHQVQLTLVSIQK